MFQRATHVPAIRGLSQGLPKALGTPAKVQGTVTSSQHTLLQYAHGYTLTCKISVQVVQKKTKIAKLIYLGMNEMNVIRCPDTI